MSGMERSGASAHGWRRTPRTADTYGDGRNDIVARIAGDIAAGLTVRQIADKRHLPVDFVDMAVERADKRGLLAVMDMRQRQMCIRDSAARLRRDDMPARSCVIGVRRMPIQDIPIFKPVQ